MRKRIHRNREEETRRVVLVTMEPEESTEVIVKPPEQEPERSTEATEKPSEPVEKEKGLETEKRESGDPKDLPEPEIPEKPFVADGESSGGNVRAGSEVSNESLVKLASSTRSEGRGEADQKSRQAASAETAAPVGSRLQVFNKQFKRDHRCDGRGL